MYPHERSLVKNLENKPFAIIGVNSDEDREKLKESMKLENITWRSFWNGGGVDGPIAARWNVHAWPTVYIIDARGVIRWKGIGADKEKEINTMIDKLIKETES